MEWKIVGVGRGVEFDERNKMGVEMIIINVPPRLFYP